MASPHQLGDAAAHREPGDREPVDTQDVGEGDDVIGAVTDSMPRPCQRASKVMTR